MALIEALALLTVGLTWVVLHHVRATTREERDAEERMLDAEHRRSLPAQQQIVLLPERSPVGQDGEDEEEDEEDEEDEEEWRNELSTLRERRATASETLFASMHTLQPYAIDFLQKQIDALDKRIAELLDDLA
jgi:hypothetical protein